MADLFNLKDEVAVVTGASGNLGPVWIDALLEHGASVFAIDRPGVDVARRFHELLEKAGASRLQFFNADVRDRRSLEAALDRCLATLGTPSVLVNNAGIDGPPTRSGENHKLKDIPFDENRDIMEVNVLGLFLVAQVFGSCMVNAGRGSIINIGSLYTGVAPDMRFYDHLPGENPFLKPPAYGASKAAVVNLTKYLATHWAAYGVRVNTLSPGGVLGKQDEEFKRKFCDRVPLGRMATHSDLRGPLIFLASSASSYITGIELKVDGGYTAW